MGRARGQAAAAVAADNFSDVLGTRRGAGAALPGKRAADGAEVPLTDDELLEAERRIGTYVPDQYAWKRSGLQDMNFLASGDGLYKAATFAPYRGHICLGKGKDGEHGFVALVTYGISDGDQANIVASGTDLKKVISKLNSQIQSKLRKGKYLPDGGDPDAAKLTREQVVAAIHARDPRVGGTPA